MLNNYQVRFSIKKFFNQDFKSMDTINDMLTMYITDYNNLPKVDQLIYSINGVLNGDYPLGGGQTQSLYLANITTAVTKIYQDMGEWEENNNIEPDYILPTSDFKEIVEAWRDYLAN